jgi:hypothetical protein
MKGKTREASVRLAPPPESHIQDCSAANSSKIKRYHLLLLDLELSSPGGKVLSFATRFI